VVVLNPKKQLVAFDVPRDIQDQAQHRILEVVLLERVAAAEAELLDIKGLCLCFAFGPVPSEESSLAVAAVDLKSQLAAGDRENSRPVCESGSFRRGIWRAKDIRLGRLFT
jgi:hypothetical protein